METKETIEYVRKLKKKDLVWKPLYPDNMPCNGLRGCYCFLWTKDEYGYYDGRKYTILFQEKEDERGCVVRGEIEFYILFENSYKLKNPFIIPDPSDNSTLSSGRFHEGYDVNSYGVFVRAYTNENKAREKALMRLKKYFGLP